MQGVTALGKMLTSPLLWATLLSVVGLTYLLARSRRGRPGRERLVSGLLLVASLALWALSAPGTAQWLARSLEAQYYPAADLTGVSAVVVLSGGFRPGPTSEQDHLGDATYARTVQGVRTFQHSRARWLVVTGALPGATPGRITALMKDLAVAMGVPAEQVLTEPRAVDTYAHPVEVGQLPGLRSSDKLAVVTSAWHLRRAMVEFRRRFPAAVPVPAEFYSAPSTQDWKAWLPGVDGLQKSTMMLHEYIGLAWYQIRHLVAGG